MDMDKLTLASSLASIISLPLSIWAIWGVHRIRVAIKDRAMDRQLDELIKRFLNIPIAKTALMPTHRTTLTTMIKLLDDFYISPLPLCDRELKKLIKILKNALTGNPSIQEIKDIVKTIETQTLNTTRI